MLGRFKCYINKRCPECKGILQIRARDIKEIRNGIQVSVSEEYISCPECGYTSEMEQKRIRRQKDDLTF